MVSSLCTDLLFQSLLQLFKIGPQCLGAAVRRCVHRCLDLFPYLKITNRDNELNIYSLHTVAYILMHFHCSVRTKPRPGKIRLTHFCSFSTCLFITFVKRDSFSLSHVTDVLLFLKIFSTPFRVSRATKTRSSFCKDKTIRPLFLM